MLTLRDGRIYATGRKKLKITIEIEWTDSGRHDVLELYRDRLDDAAEEIARDAAGAAHQRAYAAILDAGATAPPTVRVGYEKAGGEG